jgi:hypothetical protein
MLAVDRKFDSFIVSALLAKTYGIAISTIRRPDSSLPGLWSITGPSGHGRGIAEPLFIPWTFSAFITNDGYVSASVHAGKRLREALILNRIALSCTHI